MRYRLFIVQNGVVIFCLSIKVFSSRRSKESEYIVTVKKPLKCADLSGSVYGSDDKAAML
ncbi:hypothetical protein TUM4641_11940 [Shewanella morhuae]|nr:hypothetical protein TUM4641_11940 [Shewanella morhuae]